MRKAKPSNLIDVRDYGEIRVEDEKKQDITE